MRKSFRDSALKSGKGSTHLFREPCPELRTEIEILPRLREKPLASGYEELAPICHSMRHTDCEWGFPMPDLGELTFESCYSAFRKHCVEIHGLRQDSGVGFCDAPRPGNVDADAAQVTIPAKSAVKGRVKVTVPGPAYGAGCRGRTVSQARGVAGGISLPSMLKYTTKGAWPLRKRNLIGVTTRIPARRWSNWMIKTRPVGSAGGTTSVCGAVVSSVTSGLKIVTRNSSPVTFALPLA